MSKATIKMRGAVQKTLLPGLFVGISLLPLSARADPTVTNGNVAALLIWVLASSILIISLIKAIFVFLTKDMKEWAHTWLGLGGINLMAGVATFGSCVACHHELSNTLYTTPPLGLGLLLFVGGLLGGLKTASDSRER